MINRIGTMAGVFLIAAAISGCSSFGFGDSDRVNLAPGKAFQPLAERVLPGWQGAIDGDRLVTSNEEGLKVTDLAANKQLAAIPVTQVAGFDISGGLVVWSDLRNEPRPPEELGSYDVANADVFLYDLTTGEERQLTTDPSAQIHPRIWENYIVWMDNASDEAKDYPSKWQIVLYNIDTGEQKTISAGKGGDTDPDIDAGNVVWEDGRRVSDRGLRAGGNVPRNNTDIYLYRIDSGKTIPIATEDYREGRPRVSGSKVTWEAYRGSYEGDVFVHDTASGETIRLTGSGADQRTPEINGNLVVWMDERNGSSTHDVGPGPHNSDIYLADLAEGTETLVSGKGPQINPLISDRWIAYGISTDANAMLTAVRYR